MNEQQRLEHNAASQGVTIAQAKEVDRYMSMAMKDWPEDLHRYIEEHHGGDMMCGEIFVTGIAGWLKEQAAAEKQA